MLIPLSDAAREQCAPAASGSMDIPKVKDAIALINKLDMLEKSIECLSLNLSDLSEDGYFDYLTDEQVAGIRDNIKTNMTNEIEELKAQIEAL